MKRFSSRSPWSWVVTALLLLAAVYWQTVIAQGPRSDPAQVRHTPRSNTTANPASQTAFLPPEALFCIRRIQNGGPFPYRQDGAVFGNRERHLPEKPHGYYREYTVETPGLNHRGARRIVTGGNPPQIWYYSDDHYQSFRNFTPLTPGVSSR